jgi:hypothetical protein
LPGIQRLALVASQSAKREILLPPPWRSPFDIFGCDRDRPFARIDQQGLCWLVTGNRVVNLFENAAVIQTWTGQRQTWRRKPSEPGRVLAWELADGEPGGKGV